MCDCCCVIVLLCNYVVVVLLRSYNIIAYVQKTKLNVKYVLSVLRESLFRYFINLSSKLRVILSYALRPSERFFEGRANFLAPCESTQEGSEY